jgi:hypothetical protein
MKRFIELDFLRGILLLMMVVNHSPSSLRRFTDQPLGFFTTAECFVFVSAFLAGLLFRKRVEKVGFSRARSASILRAWRIYLAHLAILGFAFVIGSFFLSDFPGLRNLLDHYLLDPWAAICGSVVLLFRPPLMDILPMYILFSLLTPAAFWASQRWGWKSVLFASISIWLFSQAHVRDIWVTASKGASFIEPGPFDLLAWQLLWIVGLFFGQRFGQNKALLGSPGLQALPCILATGFLVWRWSAIALGPAPLTQTWLMDKWHLGPLRLINFFAAAWVAGRFLKYLSRWEAPLRPLALIGRHMLPIFCIEICLSILLIGRTESGLATEPVITLVVLCQLLTAPLLAWFFERKSSPERLGRSQPQPFRGNLAPMPNHLIPERSTALTLNGMQIVLNWQPSGSLRPEQITRNVCLAYSLVNPGDNYQQNTATPHEETSPFKRPAGTPGALLLNRR